MKQFLVISMLSATVLLMSGCQKPINDNDFKISDFEAIMTVTSNDAEYECEVYHTPEQVDIIKILKPDSLNGLTFSWENGKQEVSWKNNELVCDSNKNFITKDSIFGLLINVLNNFNSIESLEREIVDEKIVLSGMINDEKIKIYVAGDNITKIVFPDKNFEASLAYDSENM